MEDNPLKPIKPEDLEHHPIAQKVLKAANDKGISISDMQSFIDVVDELTISSDFDTKSAILISSILEKILVLNRIFISNMTESGNQ